MKTLAALPLILDFRYFIFNTLAEWVFVGGDTRRQQIRYDYQATNM
ncbi:MAG: hypothetical protein WCP96_09400 [Methylococcaceae bacterium]